MEEKEKEALASLVLLEQKSFFWQPADFREVIMEERAFLVAEMD